MPKKPHKPSRYSTADHFAAVPLALLDHPEKTSYHIAAFAALRSYADFGKATGAAVSDAKAAKRAGCSTRKFIDCRNDLRQWGFLRWTRLDGGVNHYVITLTPAHGADGASTPAPGADPPSAHGAQPSAPRADNLEPSPRASSLPTSSGSSNELPAGSDALTPNGLVEIVMEVGLRGERPLHWAKQSKAAKRLLDLGLNSDAIVREACRGMLLIFPYAQPPTGRRAPFDVFTLERKLAEALAAAADDKPPSDIVERQAHVHAGPRGGAPVLLGGLVEGVMKRVRARQPN